MKSVHAPSLNNYDKGYRMLTRYQALRKIQREQSQNLGPHSASQEENNKCPDYKTLKEIAYYTVSNSIAPGIEMGSHFVNIIILANKTLPASALIGSYQLLNTTTGCVILSTACTIVSNAFGEKEHNPERALAKIRHSLKGGVAFALILSVPAVISSLCSRKVLQACQQPEELLGSVEEYFIAYSWGIPAIFVVYLEKQIALGVGDIKSVNILTLLDSVSVSLLGYLFVNGILGEEMGVAGLGFASSITNWLELIFFTTYLKYGPRFRDYKFDLFSELKEVKSTLKELFRIGLPCGLQAGSEFLFLLGYSAFVGNLGVNALSAYQISSQYILLAGVLTSGLNQSTIILVGRESGAHRINQAKKIGTFCILLGGGISFLLCGFMATISKELMKPLIDVDDPENDEIVRNAQILFVIKGLMQTFDSIRMITAGSIQGAFKESKTAMISEVVNIGLIGLTLAYALGFPARLGLIGVATAQGIGVSIGGSFLLGYWLRKIKNWLLPPAASASTALDMSPAIKPASEIEVSQTLEVSPTIEGTSAVVSDEVPPEHTPQVKITTIQTIHNGAETGDEVQSPQSDEIRMPLSADMDDSSSETLLTFSYRNISEHSKAKEPEVGVNPKREARSKSRWWPPRGWWP